MKNFIRTAILILSVAMTSLPAHSQAFREQTLFGKVLDEKGETLPGAMVASSDGKRGAMTDEKGEFTMKIIQTDKFITVSFLGYLAQNVDIKGKTMSL